MKEITLPITQSYSITIDMHNLDTSNAVDMGGGRFRIPLGNIVDENITSIVETARKNGGKVLYATTSIEQKLEAILLEYFMGPFIRHNDRRVMFEREILQSSALSYRTKKELVIKLISDNELLPGNKKNVTQGYLKKIMEWRNAFAHGKIKHDSKAGCFVTYYSGKLNTLHLTDGYWDEVERCFKECDVLLNEAQQQLGHKSSNKLSEPDVPNNGTSVS